MTKMFCDICGKGDETIIEMMFVPSVEQVRHLFLAQSWRGDVCEDCRKKIKALIEKELVNGNGK